MRTATFLGAGILLATTAMPVPAQAQLPPPPGYCLEIRDLEPAPRSGYACTSRDDTRTTVPAARIHQSMGPAQRRVASKVSICATGDVNLGRFRIAGIATSTDFRVQYTRVSDGADITRAVSDGTYLTSRIKPGTCFRYRIDVVRVRKASVGDPKTYGLSANPEGPGWRTLKAATHVTAATFTG